MDMKLSEEMSENKTSTLYLSKPDEEPFCKGSVHRKPFYLKMYVLHYKSAGDRKHDNNFNTEMVSQFSVFTNDKLI